MGQRRATSMANPWEEHAEPYSQFVDEWEEAGTVPTQLIDLLGEVAGREVLDAACGTGFLARALAARGARVTGIDLSARLIEMARARDSEGTITYRAADLSQPIPDLAAHFDLVASHLALNDVADHRGFARTLAAVAKPGARLALLFNNPYSLIVRGHITNYFDNEAIGRYQGLAACGIEASYYHRTLEEYLDAFLAAGLRLTKLVDVPDDQERDWLLPRECRFPLFMILAFEKP